MVTDTSVATCAGRSPSGRRPFRKQRTVNPLMAPARYNLLYASSTTRRSPGNRPRLHDSSSTQRRKGAVVLTARPLRRFGYGPQNPVGQSAQDVSFSKNSAMSSGGQSVARFVSLSTWATVMRQRDTYFPSESTMVHSISASGPRNSRTNEVMVIS
jgi:hypothetical protein